MHQREVFLFNDILVITKIHSRKKNTVTYTFRQSYLLAGLNVSSFETQFYPYGIRVSQKWDRNKVVLTLNARNEHDRSKFVEDLKESIAEMDEMETLRLESELEKQRLSVVSSTAKSPSASSKSTTCLATNRDSGINDSAELRSSTSTSTVTDGVVLRKSAINNSLLDLTDASEKLTRRGSVGSLDSGMSISFQTTNGTDPRATAAGASGHCFHHHYHHHHHHVHHQNHIRQQPGHNNLVNNNNPSITRQFR